MQHWACDAFFYHIYPLGLCGAPRKNDLTGPVRNRLKKVLPWLHHARQSGATAILLGPVMESGSHGYDIVDYFQVDRRLGEGKTMVQLAEEAHKIGLKLVMDGVFHHVGRDFQAFRDVREKRQLSAFIDWFYIDLNSRSPMNDPFSYDSWNGCHELVKLNLNNPEVRGHLFSAVASWINEYHIDGLRLDAADHLDMDFMRNLSLWSRGLKPDFWLMGEVVKGPYTRWLTDARLDSVTNYECYKGFYSSHNDENYYEIAYTLRRHFGKEGLYRSDSLFTFVDNHDVDRLASRLKNPAHIYPIYCLLFTIPGIPAIYYGSEFGIKGVKALQDDWPLRPSLDMEKLRSNPDKSDLTHAITRLAHLRSELPALRRGDFREISLSHLHIIFSRRVPEQWLIVAVSAEREPVDLEVILPEPINGTLVDLLNPGQQFVIREGKVRILPLWQCWARIMEVRSEMSHAYKS